MGVRLEGERRGRGRLGRALVSGMIPLYLVTIDLEIKESGGVRGMGAVRPHTSPRPSLPIHTLAHTLHHRPTPATSYATA